MYYVITKNGVISSPTLEKINIRMDAKFEDVEFKALGADRVVNMSDEDIEFVQDKKRMSAIAFQNFFRKDTSPTFHFIIQILLLFIIMVGVFSS